MSLKNKAGLEYKTGERVYQFVCDTDAPLGECRDALGSFLLHVKNIQDKLEESVKKQDPPQDPPAEG